MANLTAYNIAIALIVALGGFTYGYGFGVFTNTVGQPGFYVYFNLDRKAGLSCCQVRANVFRSVEHSCS